MRIHDRQELESINENGMAQGESGMRNRRFRFNPGERIRIGIVGLNFGRWIVEALMAPGEASGEFELAAVCDLNPGFRKAMQERAGGVDAFADLDSLLAREDIPVIGLFTGPIGRAAILRRVLAAGKDVITTKPFELDPTEALDVAQYARSLGRILHINSPAPTPSADLAQIEQWTGQFALGRPVGCRAEVWVSYREQADESWRDDASSCPVAPIFRLGIYLINDLIRLFGEAECVQVLHSRIFTGRPTPDNAQLGIRFKSGALANIYASFCVRDGQEYSNSLTLNYENGTIYRNVGRLPFGGGETKLSLVARNGEAEAVIHTAAYSTGSGGYDWNAFSRAIRGEALAGEVTPEQIAAGIKVIAAMGRAEKSGQTEFV